MPLLALGAPDILLEVTEPYWQRDKFTDEEK
jgi:hypothetical protein